MAIMVQGKKCKVIDKGGYNCDIGQNWKMVELDGERVMVVGGRGFWRVWGPRDRTAPLREAIARGWPAKDLRGSE